MVPPPANCPSPADPSLPPCLPPCTPLHAHGPFPAPSPSPSGLSSLPPLSCALLHGGRVCGQPGRVPQGGPHREDPGREASQGGPTGSQGGERWWGWGLSRRVGEIAQGAPASWPAAENMAGGQGSTQAFPRPATRFREGPRQAGGERHPVLQPLPSLPTGLPGVNAPGSVLWMAYGLRGRGGCWAAKGAHWAHQGCRHGNEEARRRRAVSLRPITWSRVGKCFLSPLI